MSILQKVFQKHSDMVIRVVELDEGNGLSGSVNMGYGFAWQGFGSRGAIGVASVRSCEKLPPCLIKPVPAGSKTDPPLAKAKPISDGGRASVITYSRKGRKKTLGKTAVRERSETM